MNIPLIPKSNFVRESDITREITRKKPVEMPSHQDKVTIVDESRLVSNLLTSLKKVGNTNSSDLMKLKQQVQNGEYKPSASDIAKAILFGPPEK
jgi:anti-sigma28 factor (negative regulator of flagellin synthesis)